MSRPTLDEIKSWAASVSIPLAAQAIGISSSHLYSLAGRDEAPCKVLKVGARYRVVTASLVALLEAAG